MEIMDNNYEKSYCTALCLDWKNDFAVIFMRMRTILRK